MVRLVEIRRRADLAHMSRDKLAGVKPVIRLIGEGDWMLLVGLMLF